MAASDTAILYTDGACKGNPGPSAIGVVIETPTGETIAEISETVGRRTNNEAEYLALIRGLEDAALLGIRRVHWVTDSELLQRQLTGTYKVRAANLRRLRDRVRLLAEKFDEFTATHVLRISNTRADALANQAFRTAKNRPDS